MAGLLTRPGRRGILRKASFVIALVVSGCGAVSFMRAENAYQQGHYVEAKALAENAVREDPTNPRPRKLLAKILVRFGADALEQNDLETAKRYFEEARDLYPAEPNVDSYLSLIHRVEAKREARLQAPSGGTPPTEPEEAPRQKGPRTSAKPPEEAPAGEAGESRSLTATQDSSLYDAPSPFAAKVGSLSAGTHVSRIREAGGWYEVETRDGRRGYVRAEAVK